MLCLSKEASEFLEDRDFGFDYRHDYFEHNTTKNYLNDILSKQESLTSSFYEVLPESNSQPKSDVD